MKKTALILMLLTILSKVLGFTREVVLSYFYGASMVSDAYLISLTIPGTIFAFIGVGLATSYIPMYSNIEQESSIKLADKFTNNIINLIILICTFITIVVLTFTVSIVRVFASGFEGATLNLAVLFTRISILGIYFTGLGYVFTGYLHLKNSFMLPALMGIPFNFIIISSIILSYRVNTIYLAIGIVVAMAIQCSILISFSYNKGYKYKFILGLTDKNIKKLAYLALPVILGTSVNQINTLIDRTIASQIVIGGISALNYASRLTAFVQGIFVVSISTAMYPMISKMAVKGDLIGLKKSVSEAVAGINLLVIPATVGAMIFAEPIVRLLFGRGEFNTQAVSMTSYTLFFYAIGMIGVGLREVLSRAFYSLQETKAPMINAAIAMVMNIILNIVLSRVIGIGGLALATSISAIFCTVLLYISLQKKIGSLGIKQMSISFLKIVSTSLVMGLIAKQSFDFLRTNIISENLALVISIVIGLIIYFTIIYFIKIDEVDAIGNAIKNKIKKAHA